MGHAFEARIYAENPRNNFLPDSGPLFYLSTPTPTHVFAPVLPATTPVEDAPEYTPPSTVKSSSSGDIEPSVRLEQGFGQGSQIGVFYDPMIAKLVVHGRDRTEALRVLRKALDEYKVVGVSTNVEFLRTLAGNEAFVQGEVETGFIPVSVISLRMTLRLIFLIRNTSTRCSRQFPRQRQKRLYRPPSILSSATTPLLPRLLHPGPPSPLAGSVETFTIAWLHYKPRTHPSPTLSGSNPLLPVSSISL